MGRIFTIGEALIDFIPMDKSLLEPDQEGFIKMPGGAPANVAVAAAKLGAQSYFIGKLGNDAFGTFLENTLKANGVNTDYISKTDEANTSLAFVTLDENGERDFSFYRNPGADMLLNIEDVSNISFNDLDIISFCSVDLVDYPVRYATEYLLKKCKQANATVVFDPNIRKALWDDLEEYRKTVIHFLKYADIIKISDDEVEFITQKPRVSQGVDFLKSLGLKHIIVTLGKDGAIGYFNDWEIMVKGNKVDVVDTTGAGDAFVGSFLYSLNQSQKKMEALSEEELLQILTFSNKVASLVTTKKGAMSSLPTLSELKQNNIF